MLELAVIVSLSVLFLHSCMQEEMIFSFVAKNLWDAPYWIRKPVYECPICMSPWYGSGILALGFGFHAWTLPTIFEWFLILAIAGGLNTAVVKLSKHD